MPPKGKIRVRKRNGQIVYVTPKMPSDLLHWQAPDKFFDDPLPDLESRDESNTDKTSD